MDKSPEAFRSIGEVSRLVGVAPHVLRYWETQFTQLSPVKRGDGRRYYRPDDVRLVAGLCQVMREEGLSIRGARRLIAADRGAGLRRMGIARLGEMQMTVMAAAEPDNATLSEVAQTGKPGQTTDLIDVSRAGARRRLPQDKAPPLFSTTQDLAPSSWLLRLAQLAARLRNTRSNGGDFSVRAGQLRDRLLASR